jgi:hypothetical protein
MSGETRLHHSRRVRPSSHHDRRKISAGGHSLQNRRLRKSIPLHKSHVGGCGRSLAAAPLLHCGHDRVPLSGSLNIRTTAIWRIRHRLTSRAFVVATDASTG